VTPGPIPCPAGTLSLVYQAVSGWDTITNPADGVLGRNIETQAEFEQRRISSVAINARGSVPSIRASVATVDNVLSVYVIDNTSGNTVLKGSTNYPMKPHSIYVGVVGGLDADIAQAMFTKKDDGCDMNGNTAVAVYDTDGYDPPYPQYQYIFNRPASTPVLFQVSLVNSSMLPSNIAALVKAAIIAQFNGTQTIAPAKMGSAITGSNYYGAVIGVAPNVTVLSILVGITSATLAQVVMGIDQAPVIDDSNISVVLV
jgi:hypothetical protein